MSIFWSNSWKKVSILNETFIVSVKVMCNNYKYELLIATIQCETSA